MEVEGDELAARVEEGDGIEVGAVDPGPLGVDTSQLAAIHTGTDEMT